MGHKLGEFSPQGLFIPIRVIVKRKSVNKTYALTGAFEVNKYGSESSCKIYQDVTAESQAGWLI